MQAKETQLLLNGLHCAACVARVEKALYKVPNVSFASVNLVEQTAFIQGDIDAESAIAAIVKIGFGAELIESEQTRREKQQAQTALALKQKKQQFILALSVGSLLMAYGLWQGMALTADNRIIWLLWAALTAFTLFYCGKHFFVGAWISLKNRAATMDTLIALSTGVAWLYSFYLTLFSKTYTHLYFEASVMIIGFINLGKFLELRAKQRSSLALEKLLDLAPKQVVVLTEQGSQTIPLKGVKPQMEIQAFTGDRLAVDGILIRGHLWVDEAMLTGEALPIEKKIGDKIRAGTLVQDGAGVYQAEYVGEQTALAKVIHAVRLAQSSKPPLAKQVDKIAAVFVPIVVSIALISALIWLAVGYSFDFALSIFTTVLIIACPCALGLAIPLSTIAGVAKAAELGVLVRNMEALQACAEADTLVFDKTGTLTQGKMRVSRVETMENFPLTRLLQLAHSLEQHASHPIAKAIVAYCANAPLLPVSRLQVAKGMGMSAEIEGEQIKIGNARFVGVEQTDTPTQGSRVFISVNGQWVGTIDLQDQLRPESPTLIRQLQQQGYHCIMLTGDNPQAAQHFAEQLQLNHVIANVLPDEKAGEITRLQQAGKKVIMVGDGINDAPALTQANVGIAVQNGSDIALESADLSLMKSGLSPIAHLLPFAKKVIRNMHQSLFGAFIYNIISIPIAAGVLYPFTGWLLNPMIAAITMALSSVTVVLNSQRLLR